MLTNAEELNSQQDYQDANAQCSSSVHSSVFIIPFLSFCSFGTTTLRAGSCAVEMLQI